MTEPRKLRVFLCHASQDKPIVRELYQRLLAESWIDPWLDEEKLLPGQDWDLEIEKAVEIADVVIVCLSNRSINKEGYIQRELKFVLDIALEKADETIFLVPLRFDNCELPRRIRTWQYVDYFPDTKKQTAYQKLLKSLHIRASNIRIPYSSQMKSGNQGVERIQYPPHNIQHSHKKTDNQIWTIVQSYFEWYFFFAVIDVIYLIFEFIILPLIQISDYQKGVVNDLSFIVSSGLIALWQRKIISRYGSVGNIWLFISLIISISVPVGWYLAGVAYLPASVILNVIWYLLHLIIGPVFVLGTLIFRWYSKQ